MKKSILFIFSSYQGHLVKTKLLEEFYQKKGFDVHFILNFQPQGYDIKNLHLVNTPPFESFKSNGTEISWLQIIKNNFFGISFKNRKREVLEVVTKLNPSKIFLDTFCSSDFIYLYPYKCIVLSPFFPNRKNDRIPPLSVYADINTENIEAIWKREVYKYHKKILFKKIKYLGFDATGYIKRQFNKSNIPKGFSPDFEFIKTPSFPGLEKWYLQPEQMDFEPQALHAWERYMGPMIKMNKLEKKDSQYELFLNFANSTANRKIIFCSLGSVTNELIKDKNKILDFFKKIIAIAQENAELFFLVKVPPAVQKQLKPLSFNIFLMDYPPFYDILEKSSLFITHCGGNSYLEAIYKAVPMLCIPVINKWDYNGNAARIEYHGLGVKNDFESTQKQLLDNINYVLNEPKFKENISKMSKLFKESYDLNYLDNLI